MPRRSTAEIEADWSRGVSGTVIRGARLVHVEHVWTTAISLVIPEVSGREDAALAAVERCRRWFAEVDECFSAYRPDSEVSRYRRGDRAGFSDNFVSVLSECGRLRELTGGAFDPWAVPGGFEPSAYVKGWAADRASALLGEAGFASHLINAGGDVCARGNDVSADGESGWPVGIVNPYEPGQIIRSAHLRDEGMATSGHYERGAHVVDPATGEATTAIDSATVVGPDLGMADALATAALVRGDRAVEWLAELGSDWSLYLVRDGAAWACGPAFDEGHGAGGIGHGAGGMGVDRGTS